MASGRWDPEKILLYLSTIYPTLSRWRRPYIDKFFEQGRGGGNCQLFIKKRKAGNLKARLLTGDRLISEGRVGFISFLKYKILLIGNDVFNTHQRKTQDLDIFFMLVQFQMKRAEKIYSILPESHYPPPLPCAHRIFGSVSPSFPLTRLPS